MLATLVDSYLTSREEFQMTNGYQPIDSLFYIKKGEFFCEIQGEKHIVQAGDIAIFDSSVPMTRHILAPLQFLYIKFHVKQGSLFPIPSGVYHAPNSRVIEDLVRIENLSSLHTRAGLNLRNHYFNDLLLQLSHNTASPLVSTEGQYDIPSALNAPIAYLREHLSAGVTVEEVARACGCSVSSLESKFRDLLGISLYRYFISLRMEEAKRLLIGTRHSVTEISARLGFDNLFYFCNAFKKYTCVTPTEYRNQNLI